jgi:ubiquinone/menaquinone biosynthesis C-methylase UbiE
MATIHSGGLPQRNATMAILAHWGSNHCHLGLLRAGARVADIGCGHGASTILMAKAYRQSQFVGFDYHAPSIEAAREKANAARVSDRVNFEVAQSKAFPGRGYDLVAFFDLPT